MLKNRLRLFLIVLISLLSSCIFYVIQLIYTYSENSSTALIYQQSLLSTINQYAYLPELLSEDLILLEALQGSELNQIAASKKLKFISVKSGAEVAYIMDVDGKVIAASNHDQEDQGFLNKNYGFRPYFQQAIRQRSRQFYYAEGATTGIPGFFISYPIIKNGIVLGVSVLKLDLRALENKWKGTQDNIIVSNENSVIVLSSNDEWRYKATATISEEVKLQMIQQQQFSGRNHPRLYQQLSSLKLPGNKAISFWLIDHKLFMVRTFDIGGTGWKLHFLIDHKVIVASTILFFLTLMMLVSMGYLIVKTRQSINDTKNRTALLKSKRKDELLDIINNINVGIVLFSKEGNILSSNKYAQDLLFGDVVDESKTIKELINSEVNDKDNSWFVGNDGDDYQELLTTGLSGEKTPTIFSVREVNFADDNMMVMTIINIKRRKNAETELVKINEYLEEIIEFRTKELQETQSELSQKNKIASLGNMAATIVHELSQPLSAMNSSVAAITAKINKDDWGGAKQSADRLKPISKKMFDIIQLLRFFSYQDNEVYQEFDVRSTVDECLDDVKEILDKKSIKVFVNHDKEQMMLSANPLKIELVISNIIKNAIDALENSSNPIITINTFREEEKIKISIIDNAGGIDESIMEKLFTAYFTTKEVGKGLGLGLAISHEIIQQYGGEILVKNIEGGANFTLSFINKPGVNDE